MFWDQRGHGRSERGTPSSHTIDQIGRDLYTVLEAVCPDGDVVLVGHSMGGMTIMALAAEHPELFGGPEAGEHARVRGVVLCSTTDGHWNEMTLGLPARAAQLFQRTAPGVFALLGRGHTLVDRTRRAGTDLAQLLTRRYAFASDVPPALVRFTDEMLSSTPMDVIADFFPTFSAHEKDIHAAHAGPRARGDHRRRPRPAHPGVPQRADGRGDRRRLSGRVRPCRAGDRPGRRTRAAAGAPRRRGQRDPPRPGPRGHIKSPVTSSH